MMPWKNDLLLFGSKVHQLYCVSYITADAQLKNVGASGRANLVSVIEMERSCGPLSTTLSGRDQLFAVRLTPLS